MTAKKTHDYQALNQELDVLIQKLQNDDISIDDALKSYERGVELIELLQKQLTEAENKVKKIKTQPKRGD